jgi:hypothetical protein
MKRLLIIALAIAAPAHAQLGVVPRTEEERGSLQAYSACLYGFAREMDDGRIAPMALARKIAPKCRFQLRIAAGILSRGKPRAARDTLYRTWLAIEEQRGVETVLTMRRDRRAMSSDPADPRQGKPAPPKPAAAKPVATTPPASKAKPAPIPTTGPDGKPISAWRRAYIAKHGHQPPVPER